MTSGGTNIKKQSAEGGPRIAGASGGLADKLGNSYELACAVRYALRCLQDQRRSITLEDLDPSLANGSEFTFVDEHGAVTVTQVKRQNNANDNWTIAALRGRGIFAAAQQHVVQDRRYVFSSITATGELRNLADRSRQSDTLQLFTDHQLTKTLRPRFDELTSADIFGTSDAAWRTLRGMWFESEPEDKLSMTNEMLADVILEGATGSLIVFAIGAVLLDNLRIRLTRRELLDGLKAHGISARGVAAKQSAHEEVQATTQSWRSTIERELLATPIRRSEADDLVALMNTTRVALVVGAGGGGKSSVLYQGVEVFKSRDVEVLAFRLDRRGAFSSISQLGAQLGLSTSPVAALRLAADGRDALLIIDQLDAVSLASGRLSERYNVVADLIQEALTVDGVRVVLACRLFDVENDHRIRKLDARPDVERLTVAPLDDEAVNAAVTAMGLDATALSTKQQELLRSPLNLVLLESVADQPQALNFTSRGSLFAAFWDHKRQTIRDQHPEVRFNDVLARVAVAVSDQQSLSIPVELLDADDYATDAQVLASEQVLAIDNDRVSFFHETFFDYTFARQWLTRGESLVDFLCAQEQELFRRAQVRQILELLRERDADRFRREIEDLLTSPKIRFHIKEMALVVFANVATPGDADLDLALRIAASDTPIARRVWHQIMRPTWFGCVNARGIIEAGLNSNDQVLRERAASWLGNGGPEHCETVASLLSARRDAPEYAQWLGWLAQRVDLHHNRAVFDLFLDAIRDGDLDPANHNVWLSAHDLGAHQPRWAIELLSAGFVQSPNALGLTADGKVALLGLHEYGATQLIDGASVAEPQAFAEAVVPHLLDVMRVTQLQRHEGDLLRDRHFSLRFPRSAGGRDDIDDSLFEGASRALAAWAASSPTEAEPLLRLLAESEFDGAQALLYRGLIGGAEPFAEWSAELLLEGGTRLDSGYLSDYHWLSREVLEAIAPHVSDDTHARLETELRDLRNPSEHGSSFGYTAFKFLSALPPERLSALGTRRLAEYRRKFECELPRSPTGIISYTVTSPIDDDASAKMNDEQWLRAMSKHDTHDRDFGSEIGGARELSQTLAARTAQDPLRFAGLALKLSNETNENYASAILRGFGDATMDDNCEPYVSDAIRHIASLRFESCDRWLGWAVRRMHQTTPIDLVELIRDRALTAQDPADDSPVFTRQGEQAPGADLWQNGMNTARGALAESLGDLLVSDADGSRTALVSPRLLALAADPVLSVRSCVAHTIAACLRHARPEAYEAFAVLIDSDDLLLASELLNNLMIYIGNVDPDVIDPVIDRMLVATSDEVRRKGGCMAAFAALQWSRPQLMETALQGDVEVRTGVAEVCAARVDRAADSQLVIDTLRQLMHDSEEKVREAVGALAWNIRGKNLRAYADFLADYIASPTYITASMQLLLTLQESSDQVDDLVDRAARRFLDVHDDEVADIRTGAAGDAHHVSELIVRALAQTDDKNRISALLDILDRLVELGVYGVDRAIDSAARD